METPTTNHEIPSDQQGRNALQLDEVVALRAVQKEAYNLLEKSSAGDADKFYDGVMAEMESSVASYLLDHGIIEDNPRFSEYVAALRHLSYDNISDSSWTHGAWRDASRTELGPTGSDLLTAQQKILFGEALDATPVEEQKVDPELNDAQEKLGTLRDELAEITAKRQGKAVSLSSKKYLRARRRYNEQLQKVGKLELADTLDDESLDSTEKNEAVIGYIFDEQAKLREKTTELLQGTKVGKFVEFMNKGNTFTRILKGAGIGVAAGLGGALAVGSGLAGAGVIAGAAVATGRFSRGFARSDARGGRGMATTLDEDYRQSLQASLESAGDAALKDVIDSADSKFAEDTQAEKKKRRKSVRSGVGAIALGGVIGAGIHLASEMPQLFHPFGSDTVDAKPGADTVLPTSPDTTGGDLGGGETGTGTEGLGDHVGRGEMFNGYQGSREFTAEGQKDFNEWISKNGGYEVKSGDSVWNLSEKYLEANGVNNPTVYEVDAVKDSVLKELQAQGLADSRGWLSVGDTIKIK